MPQRCRLANLILLMLVLGAAPLAAQNELMSYAADTSYAPGAGKVQALAYDVDGGVLAAATEQSGVALYDLAGKRQITSFPTRGRVLSLAFSRDGAYLAAGTTSRTVYLWDLHTHAVRELSGHRGDVRSVAFSPVNDVLASGGADRTIILWSIPGGQELGRLTDGSRDIELLKFSGPRGEVLISVGGDRQLIYWDVKNKTRLRQSEEPDAYLPSATTSAAGEWLILGTEMTQLPGFRGGIGVNRGGLVYQDRIKFYDSETGMARKVIENLTAEPTSISLSADDKVVAVAQRDGKRSFVALWDVDRGTQFAELPVPEKVTEVAFSPNGKWLAYGDERGTVSVLGVRGVTPRLEITASLQGRKYTVTSPRTPLVRPTRRVRFAVLDLDDNGVGPEVTRAIADQLANRLAANPAVRLVERRRIATLLREQDFQHSGRTETSGAVRMARILNVQKVIMGAVAKLGTTMTITAQLVDVETAQIDGVREMQCQACSLEDLPEAVAEMSETLVAPPDPSVTFPAEPPQIEIQSPSANAEVQGQNVTIRGTVKYASDLQGIELVVNGEPYTAARTLEPAGAKLTQLAEGTKDFTFVQNVPLAEDHNVIAVRAVGRDGNDEQQYLVVRRIAAAHPATPAELRSERPPALSLRELEDALANHVSSERLASLVSQFGIDFSITQQIERQLLARGADAALIARIRGMVR